jgi:alpha-ketoglutarate-dependent 2,4-dichlorophenoxyacetate dioxygenase
MGGHTEVWHEVLVEYCTNINQFADSRTAYDDLSDDMKKKLEGLVAAHSLFHSRKTAVPEFFEDLDPGKMELSRHYLAQRHEWSDRMVGITRHHAVSD